MPSDYLKLTNVDGKTVRVAYDSVEVILPTTNSLSSGVPIAGSTIYTSSGARLWVQEQPDYIDYTVQAMQEEHTIDYFADDEEE